MGVLDVGFTLLKIGVVFGLLLLTLKLLARYQGRSGGPGLRRSSAGSRRSQRVLEVMEQVRIGRTSSVALVRLGDRARAIVVTDQNVIDLGEVDVSVDPLEVELEETPDRWGASPGSGESAPARGETGESPAWAGILSHLRERSIRR